MACWDKFRVYLSLQNIFIIMLFPLGTTARKQTDRLIYLLWQILCKELASTSGNPEKQVGKSQFPHSLLWSSEI